jgi:acyl-CoA reductase-like NAD-dependent aldehyde dehydrogenase
MKAASEHLVPVTLELGGKSPAIVAKGHVMDRTVCDIVFGKLVSGGQTCIAPDHALVHESEIDAFIARCDRQVKAAYSGGPTSEDYPSIVDDKQHKILTDLIDDARRTLLDRTTFGGVGASGVGKHHGVEGFRTLSHPKGIYTQGRLNATRLLRAPFTKRTEALLNFFLR